MDENGITRFVAGNTSSPSVMMDFMRQPTRIRINVPGNEYDAIIGSGLLSSAGEHFRDLVGVDGELFVVTVPPVRRKWGRTLTDSLKAARIQAKIVEMLDGERHKKLSTVELLAENLTRLGAQRDAVVVAFGGGIVGDVAGMLASIYMRGVKVVQVPTTVLAQVDASIGGKTGVNLRTGKNLLGTFHQPVAVLIDPSILATLPDREFRAGLYESLKCGVIGNAELFRRLENADGNLLRNDATQIEWIITESVKLKADVVSKDEREGGLRRVLNFGHTIGHALEAQSKYRRFLHGEAIAWGMIAATNIAIATGRLDHQTGNKITNAVRAIGPLPRVTAASRDILRLLHTDKKTAKGKIHFVLPTAIGQVEIVNDVPESVTAKAVDGLREV